MSDHARDAPPGVDIETVSVPDLLATLEEGASDDGAASGADRDRNASRDDGSEAVRTLVAIAESRPERLRDHLPAVRSLLESDADEIRGAAIEAIRHLADARPDAVGDATIDALRDRLGRESQRETRSVAEALSTVLEADDPRLERAIADCFELFDGDGYQRGGAVQALVTLGEAFPDAVFERLERLLADSREGDEPDGRAGAVRVVAALANEYPDRTAALAPALFSVLEDGDAYAIRHATAALATVARRDPAAIRDGLDRLLELLDADDDRTRRNAVRVVLELGRHGDGDERRSAGSRDESRPDAVDAVVDDLIARLEDGDKIVRRDACYALGVLRAERARDAIAPLTDAGDLELAAVATAALERLNGEETDPPLPELEPGEVFVRRAGR